MAILVDEVDGCVDLSVGCLVVVGDGGESVVFDFFVHLGCFVSELRLLLRGAKVLLLWWPGVISLKLRAGVYFVFRQEEWARLVDGPATCCGVVCHRLQETQVCGVDVSWLCFAVVVDGEAVLDEEEPFNLAE